MRFIRKIKRKEPQLMQFAPVKQKASISNTT
jgi:hypothetical protein